MKKISLFLFTLCVSVASVFAGLNPYAYDLKSEWNPETQILRVHFTLNDHPNTDQKIVNGKPTNETGIQIFALDRNNTSKLYCIYMVPAADIIAHINENNYQYDLDIPVNGRDLVTGEALPTGKDLTFAVRVQGLNKTNKSTPTAPVYANDSNRPFSCHGVAVNNYQDSPDFGAVYVTEAANDSELSGTWNWLRGRGKAVLQYTPSMIFEASYRKSSAFSDRKKTLLEPHRVCVSDDGRVFVSSYNYVTDNSKPVVWEMLKNAKGTVTYNPVIYHNEGYPDHYGHRVCGMDVKGSGNNIKIILCYIAESTTNKDWANSFRIYEYSLNSLNASKNNGTLKYRHKPTGNSGDGSTGSEQGAMEYAIRAGQKYVVAGDVTSSDPYFYTDGFANVSYAGANKNDIILSIDYYIGQSYHARLLYLEGGTSLKSTQALNKADHYYGGAGIHSYMDGTNQYIVSGRGRYHGWESGSYKANGASDGRIHTYTVSSGSISSDAKSNWTLNNTMTRCITNDMAMDCANNIYAVSFTDGTTGAGTGRLLAFAMPYSGETTTIAPNISTSQTFNLPPVPNILATDLCCTPHDTKPKYIFSFNVNTKPEGAEIRFYTTEETMLADTAASGYDKYDNHNNCAYYYRFTEGELKQGRMLVELDILGHKEGKELSDKKLPAGKLYWNVYLKTRESLAFAPIYVQPLTDASGNRTHYRLHATIDNNPDNDGFGHIYAIDYQKVNNDESMKDNPCALMVYTIGDADVDDNNFNGVKSTTRYSLLQNLSTDNMVQPRRPAVAPDGMVYLTDYGDYRHSKFSAELSTLTPSEAFKMGGIWLFDPTLSENKKITGEATLSRFYEASETTSGVSFYGSGSSTILYKSNTYEEISHHGQAHYREEAWANNGYRVYNVGNTDGTINHSAQITDGSLTALPHLDANGSFSVKATSDGVWLCQHRTIAEDAEAVSVLFCNKNGAVKFNSYGANTTNGQPLSNVLKYTPGGGMTVSPDEKYLYVVNYEGNILEFEIGGSAATGKTLTFKNKFINNTDHKTISTMNFDYAGNLVVTTDESYPAGREDDGSYEESQIVVFTMPYNRHNARTIPASKSERLVPERLSQDFDNTTTLNTKGTYALDLYRPLQGATYNTICLPFDLDLSKLTTPHKLYGAKAMEFTSVSNPTVGGEKVLCLNFTPVTQLQAGIPYIIYVENHVRGLIEFANVTRDNTKTPTSETKTVEGSNITYTGVYNPTPLGVGNTILVDQNRLANVTNEGTLSGFRGYFTIPESLRSLKAMISTRNDTPTGLEDMNITERTYQKFLREGRVYIRVGETLYTITGEKVE